ncbi:MAG: hypothetical protein EON54_26040 [Alcaligenaceae bacterium]|nr:MAG: hypothetical protein EON54_26040 [Alcaligenaceae bacterium]
MTSSTVSIPEAGIPLLPNRHLFLVDVEVEPDVHERRAFMDLGAAINFIGKRESRISAFMSPVGLSTDAMLFATVEEAYQSRLSRTYLLRFAHAPSLVLKLPPESPNGEFEPFHRVYPPIGV